MMFRPGIWKRAYHSIEHASAERITGQITHKILDRALTHHVPTHGFKEISILNACSDLHYARSPILSVFEKDPVKSLVEYNLSSKRLALSKYREELAHADKSVMLKNLIRKRLELNQPIIQQYAGALSLMVLPSNVTTSIDELLKLADEFYYLINDQSNDFSWYSKRLSVATVYVQSELHMLQQNDFEKTINFMKGRIDELDKLGKAYTDLEEWSLFNMMSLINLIKSQLARG